MNSQNGISKVHEKSNGKKWFRRIVTGLYGIVGAGFIIPEIEYLFPKSIEVEIVGFKQIIHETIIGEDKVPIIDYSIDVSPLGRESFGLLRALHPSNTKSEQRVSGVLYETGMKILNLTQDCQDGKVIAIVDINPLFGDQARNIKSLGCKDGRAQLITM